MKCLLAAAAFVVGFAAGSAAAVDAGPAHDIVAAAAADIAPAYGRFASEISSLKEGVAALCTKPSSEALAAAQDGFS